MRPFIPAKDLTYFEHFVEHIDVTAADDLQVPSGNNSATQSAARSYRSVVGISWTRYEDVFIISRKFYYRPVLYVLV